MKPPSLLNAVLLTAGVSTLAIGWSVADAGGPQQSHGTALMKDFSTSFTALEKTLSAKDMEASLQRVDELGAACSGMKLLKPNVNTEHLYEFERHVAQFGALIGEIREHTTQSRPKGAAQAFEELRATCVSCHVKFRSNNLERGNFPARDNTLVGSVSLRDVDGETRTDRSWVLVFLEAGKDAPPYVWQRGTAKLSQRLRRFEPRVLPVVVGTPVEFPNDDTIFHNVFSLSKTARFDLGTYEPGGTAVVSMDQTGLVKVYCNIHPDMSASIVVLANPWYALTDRGGQFVICNVPAGEYLLRAWNDRGGEARKSITIGGDGSMSIVNAQIEVRETLRVVAHNNKFGKAYPEKY